MAGGAGLALTGRAHRAAARPASGDPRPIPHRRVDGSERYEPDSVAVAVHNHREPGAEVRPWVLGAHLSTTGCIGIAFSGTPCQAPRRESRCVIGQRSAATGRSTDTHGALIEVLIGLSRKVQEATWRASRRHTEAGNVVAARTPLQARATL